MTYDWNRTEVEEITVGRIADWTRRCSLGQVEIKSPDTGQTCETKKTI